METDKVRDSFSKADSQPDATAVAKSSEETSSRIDENEDPAPNDVATPDTAIESSPRVASEADAAGAPGASVVNEKGPISAAVPRSFVTKAWTKYVVLVASPTTSNELEPRAAAENDSVQIGAAKSSVADSSTATFADEAPVPKSPTETTTVALV